MEASISIEVWMENAPSLFDDDASYINQETRSTQAEYHDDAPPNGDYDSFEVDGATVWFSVS